MYVKRDGVDVLAKFSSSARRIDTEDRPLSPCTANESALIEQGIHPRMHGYMDRNLGDQAGNPM